MKTSPSTIKTWMQCGLQAKFKYIDRLPDKQHASALLGSILHLVIEQEHDDVDAAVSQFVSLWDNPLDAGFDPPDIWSPRTSHDTLRDKGCYILRTFFEAQKDFADEVLAKELRFCVPFGSHSLSGIIDALYVNDETQTLRVVDWKSGYRPNKEGLYLNIQFTTYLYAVSRPELWMGAASDDPNNPNKYSGLENGESLFKKYRGYKKIGQWFDLRNGKAYDVGPRGSTDLVRLHRCLDQIEAAMERQVFVPDISGDTCRICSYQEQCTVYLDSEQTNKGLDFGDSV